VVGSFAGPLEAASVLVGVKARAFGAPAYGG